LTNASGPLATFLAESVQARLVLALAAIQGLYEMLKQKEAEIHALKESVARLQTQQTESNALNTRVAALEKLLTALTAKISPLREQQANKQNLNHTKNERKL